jgi:hypothetical protein
LSIENETTDFQIVVPQQGIGELNLSRADVIKWIDEESAFLTILENISKTSLLINNQNYGQSRVDGNNRSLLNALRSNANC